MQMLQNFIRRLTKDKENGDKIKASLRQISSHTYKKKTRKRLASPNLEITLKYDPLTFLFAPTLITPLRPSPSPLTPSQLNFLGQFYLMPY